jgi:AraC-like DNA-binding protein
MRGTLMGYLCLNISITTPAKTLVYARDRRYSGHKTAEFAHDHHQLILVADGAISTQNKFGTSVVPAGCGAWIPAHMRHSVEPLPAARVRTLYIGRARELRGRATLEISPLLRAIADHICRLEVLRDDDAAAKRLFALLIDQLGDQRELPLFVPALNTPLAQRVARALQSDPADTPRIRDLAAELAVSDRTLERAFLADAGMTLGEWRQRSRIRNAIALLAAGGDVKDVALEVGYATPSAFVTAFKKYVGITPGRAR